MTAAGASQHGVLDAVIEEIRAITAREVPIVAAGLPFEQTGRGRHEEYFAMQRAGEALCLIAWRGAVPVGHLLLRWKGTRRAPMAAALRDCPHISAVVVRADCRSQGIGSRLLATADAQAHMRGYLRVGLNVSLANVRARALYDRVGYRTAGFPPQQRHWEWTDPSGARRFEHETTIYLIKQLE